jgi:hypothetical protein
MMKRRETLHTSRNRNLWLARNIKGEDSRRRLRLPASLELRRENMPCQGGQKVREKRMKESRGKKLEEGEGRV